MKVTGRRIRDILMIGIPASITNIMQTFMMVMTNNFLLTYGTDKVAAMGIALKVNMITALVLVGFAFGGQPLVGYNYGAKNEKRLKNILKFAYLFEMGLGLLFTILMCIFAPQIIKVFMDKPDIITNGAMMLRFQQIGMTFMSVSLISTCVCQAVGNAGGAFVLSISRQGVIYVLALFIMSNVFGYTGVLVSQACSDVVTALIAAVIMLKIMHRNLFVITKRVVLRNGTTNWCPVKFKKLTKSLPVSRPINTFKQIIFASKNGKCFSSLLVVRHWENFYF